MATFTNLHHVGEVLVSVIEDNVDPPLPAGQVMVGPPLDDPNSSTELVRVSLLWQTEQPSHVNDPFETEFDGSRTPPPLTLSSFFMVTCYGTTTQGDPLVAQQLLGSVMRTMHVNKRLALPLTGLPGVGAGRLDVDLFKITPEFQEKLWGPLQLKHRTYALYEVGPVQLVSLEDARPPAQLVMPGGVRLSGPTPTSPPTLERVVPPSQALDGTLRIDGDFPAGLDRIWVGDVAFDPADITVVDAGHTVTIDLAAAPASLTTGVVDLTLVSSDTASEPEPVQLATAGTTSLDPPAATSASTAADLVLTGRDLGDATSLVAWPDAGIQAPDDVVFLALSSVGGASVTVAAAEFANLSPGLYRFSLQVQTGTNPHQYTPHLVLEVTS